MIRVDLHTHCSCSHGANSVREMFAAGRARGLSIQGFSEHSPRPKGYDYPTEYRDRLSALYPGHVREVRELAAEQAALPAASPDGSPGASVVLLGLELDWLEDEAAFMADVVRAYPYDYIIGGIHFLGHWGFDWSADEWAPLDDDARARLYERYYRTMIRMAGSGLFHIAAHPDLIKIFSVDSFRAWLERPASLDLVAEALTAVRDAGMAMEISSAGLRKPCREIYPGPAILRLAADLGVPVTFASDAHRVDDVAAAFDVLARYAADAGYTESLVFQGDDIRRIPF